MACLAFSPDGKLLATAGLMGKVTIRDAVTGEAILDLTGEEASAWTWSLAFSPDGRCLAAGHNAGIVDVYDTATWEVRLTLKGHTDAIMALAFFPDSKTLVSGSNDGTVRFWDVETGQERITLRDHRFPVAAVAVASNGKAVAAASGHGTVKLWRASAETEAQAKKEEAASPAVYHHLAWQMATHKQPLSRNIPRALALAEKAVQWAPEEGLYWRTVGIARYRAGDYKGAITALEKSFKLGFQRGSNRFFLAMANWQLGRKQEARHWFEQAVEWMEKNMPSNEELLRFLEEAEECSHGDAEEFYTRTIEQQQSDPDRRLRRARFFARRNDWERAREDLLKAVDLRPNGPELLLREIAAFCLRSGHREEAIAAYHRAIERNPDNWQLQLRRSQLESNVVVAWNFDAGPEAWQTLRDCTISASEGVLTAQASGPDPQLIVQVGAPPGWKELTVWVRAERECRTQLFWTTERDPHWAEERSVFFAVKPASPEWSELKVRFHPSARLTGLRLDPDYRSGIQWEVEAIILANIDPPLPR